MNQKPKKILITGGAGFIGSHLAEKLLNQGHQIICLDNFFTGSIENIKHLLRHPNFKLIEADITDLKLVKKIKEIDEIYNLASPASPIHYQYDPIETVKANTLGVINILEIAKKTGAKILQASTSEVYGDPKEHPQNETYLGNVNPLSSRACYDEGKRCAETLFMDYQRQYNLPIKIVRIFNTYGPKMTMYDGRVMSNFIIQALKGEEITIYGQGIQTRSFCYIDDLVTGLIKMMAKDNFTGPVNLGNPLEISVLELAKKIIQLTNSPSKIVYQSLPEADPQRRCPDISLAKEVLNWQPKIDFELGLKNTLGHFQERLKIKPRVLIFSPAYLPLEGPVEKAVKEITQRIPDWHFDLICAKLNPQCQSAEQIGQVNVFRFGRGSLMDKYLLPLGGFFKARKLHQNNKYKLVWPIMASYGGLAALFFKLWHRKIPLLLTIGENLDSPQIKRKAKIIYPLYKLIFRKATCLHLIDAKYLPQTQKIQNKNIQVIPIEFDNSKEAQFDLMAKRMREIYTKLLVEAEYKSREKL